jgi:ribonuclease T2
MSGVYKRATIISITFAFALFSGGQALARDRRQNEPGNFAFYLLTLSWSPSFCASTERAAPANSDDRGRATRADQHPGEGAGDQPRPSAWRRSRDEQCGEQHSFVVHGLWPQYERGFPEFCQIPAPRLSRKIVSSMLDLMPSPQLIFREWDRHCSGLPARAYFDNIRRARASVKIPEQYLGLRAPLTVTPTDVKDAFIKANPGLTRESISVACDAQRLSEVRICMSKEFEFQDCPEVAQRSCRRDKLVMPPSSRRARSFWK